MTIGNKTRDEKLQHDINRQAAKISALSSGKVDKFEYLTGGKMLPLIKEEQAKFTYSRLGKALVKQTKAIKYQG